MDVRQYFDPIDFSKYSGKQKDTWRHSFGQNIEKSTKRLSVSNINKVEVAIFSVPFFNGVWKSSKGGSTEKIRSSLYQLANIDKKLNIVDFGQIRKNKSQKGILLAIRDVIEYFSELNIVTLIIGGSQDLTVGIADAFISNPYFSLTCIDSVLDVKKGRESFSSANFLSRIFQKNPKLFQFNLVGYQTHLVADEYFSKTKGIGNHVRLGQLWDNLIISEPAFRNSDALSFDLSVLKFSEIPGYPIKNPNGLYSEEACQLAKYAGLSNRLKVFGIFSDNWESDSAGISEKLSAEILWYFIEGFNNRIDKKSELPANLLTYKVELEDIDNPIVFYQSPANGRWWFEVQTLQGEKILIACSENEYREASSDEIPEIWLKYIQKIDEISK